MRISDGSSDVCSSDLPRRALLRQQSLYLERAGGTAAARAPAEGRAAAQATLAGRRRVRSAAAARLPAAVVHAGRGDGAHLGAAWGARSGGEDADGRGGHRRRQGRRSGAGRGNSKRSALRGLGGSQGLVRSEEQTSEL